MSAIVPGTRGPVLARTKQERCILLSLPLLEILKCVTLQTVAFRGWLPIITRQQNFCCFEQSNFAVICYDTLRKLTHQSLLFLDEYIKT